MPSEFVKIENEIFVIHSISDLKDGELLEIIEGKYSGCVVTKVYGNVLVLVYSNGNDKPFETTWTHYSGNSLGFKVRKLGKGEKIILTND